MVTRCRGAAEINEVSLMVLTALMLQLALAAICRFVKPPFSILRRMRACIETGNFRAICGWRAASQGAFVALEIARPADHLSRTHQPRIGLIFILGSATPCRHILHSIVTAECRSSCRNVSQSLQRYQDRPKYCSHSAST
jgi:hypothetical protein